MYQPNGDSAAPWLTKILMSPTCHTELLVEEVKCYYKNIKTESITLTRETVLKWLKEAKIHNYMVNDDIKIEVIDTLNNPFS